MTTIALKDGWLAADTQATRGDMRSGTQSKLVAVTGGRMAMLGYAAGAHAIVDWHEGGRRGPPPHVANGEMSGSVIWVPDDGAAASIEAGAVTPLSAAPFHAFGTGESFAIGAMAAGASAVGAVAIACRYDVWSGGEAEVIGPPKGT